MAELHETLLGHKHPSTFEHMHDMALKHRGRDLAEAEKLGEKVLQLRKEVLGVRHLDTIQSMDFYSSVLLEQRRYKEGEKLASQVFELRKEVLGARHRDTQESMDTLHFVRWKQARYEEAVKLEAANGTIGKLVE